MVAPHHAPAIQRAENIRKLPLLGGNRKEGLNVNQEELEEGADDGGVTERKVYALGSSSQLS
jgi:hypothetical protein